jgi:quercetin dioxygenase-like cupin family protein
MPATQLAPMVGRKTVDNTYRYPGGTISILVAGENTGGAFSIWESALKPGGEPPLHVHHTADETFYVLEGNVRFVAAGEVRDAVPGDVVFVPRGAVHTFRIKSAAARMLTVATPAGFEEWFREMGQPVDSLELPAETIPFAESDFPRMMAISKRLDTEIIPHPVDL